MAKFTNEKIPKDGWWPLHGSLFEESVIEEMAAWCISEDKEIAKISSEESFEFDENGLKTYLKQVITEIKKEREWGNRNDRR